jgi:hypothetical protein
METVEAIYIVLNLAKRGANAPTRDVAASYSEQAKREREAIEAVEAMAKAGPYAPAIVWDLPLRPVNDCDLRIVQIGGVDHHIEAWEVYETMSGEQQAVCPESCHYDELTTHMTEGAGRPVRIDGRDYYVVVTPFQE